MYNWRKMTEAQRKDVLRCRRDSGVPWHSPRHVQSNSRLFHITAACYNHEDVIGAEIQRMVEFECSFRESLDGAAEQCHAYVILPNHYHALIKVDDLKSALKELFKLHQKTGYTWNKVDAAKGRRVWCNVLEHAIKSERHFWATINYIHHNPVKHGFVKRWLDWPFSSAKDYLEGIGRSKAIDIWKEYDISRMGEWDQ